MAVKFYLNYFHMSSFV